MDLRVPEDANRDFVAGAFVVEKQRVLFLNHKKYGVWLQPGGHIESRETPDECAIRETLEETGIEIEIIGANTELDDSFDLPQPLNVNLHQIDEHHWHCDFQYLGRLVDEIEDQEYAEENIRWFSREELENKDLNMPENARRTALKALDCVLENKRK